MDLKLWSQDILLSVTVEVLMRSHHYWRPHTVSPVDDRVPRSHPHYPPPLVLGPNRRRSPSAPSPPSLIRPRSGGLVERSEETYYLSEND